MAVTHYDPYFDEEDPTEVAICGTHVGENYQWNNNWNYVSCKKCLKMKVEMDIQIQETINHRAEEDASYMEFISNNQPQQPINEM